MCKQEIDKMKIYCLDNQYVELKIIGYQFPGNTNDEYDRNWLNIFFNVNSNLGNWQCVDPSLLTFELEELIDWFITLSRNEEPKYILQEFIEPNLSWQLMNDWKEEDKKIRMNFDLESKPKSANEEDKYFVDFSANKDELIRIATDLKNELARFPYRKLKL